MVQTASDQEEWGGGLQLEARPEPLGGGANCKAMDSKWSLGRAALPGLRLGVAGKGWNRSSWKAGSGLMCRGKRRGSGPRPRRADPRPHGAPTPRKLWVCTRPVRTAEPSLLPVHRRAGAACGPGRSASSPPSSRPRTSVSAGCRAGHARRSCRRLRPCRKPPPPPASRPVSSAALRSASSGPVAP